ncbi:uncharacterized protein LOC126298789 [Schistocerca gregaria]|uniref:uncharacterized protein LOC126298789 n=1 Tax=Schistocerca gregaria TaxID=7010 RepID=UPI00211F34D8|nr:uncharacterized protein LOC126298789 [Schistocerca gregaria]
MLVIGSRVYQLVHLGTYVIKPLHGLDADTQAPDPRNPGNGARNFTSSVSSPMVSAGAAAADPENKRQYQEKRRRHVTDQADAEVKRPRVKDEPPEATEAHGKNRAVPLKVRGITCKDVFVNGREGVLVTVSWEKTFCESKPELKTESKDAVVPTIAELQDNQNAQRTDHQTVRKTESIYDNAMEVSRTYGAKQQAEYVQLKANNAQCDCTAICVKDLDNVKPRSSSSEDSGNYVCHSREPETLETGAGPLMTAVGSRSSAESNLQHTAQHGCVGPPSLHCAQ